VARLFEIPHDCPLIGHVAFGLIDRGTNLIQIRPTSLCNLSCIFCSVDAGPNSRNRQTEYIVHLDHLIHEFRIAIREKELSRVHAYIDAAGDPITYRHLVELVQELSNIEEVETICLETHGFGLSYHLIDELEAAGLTRVNLSIDALDEDLARYISGTPAYDVKKIAEIAEYIAKSTEIDILIAPVWLPGVNDREIEKIIRFALKIGAGKRVPPLGIQKYIAHKYGRKPKGVREVSWKRFYVYLKRLEEKYKVRLILDPVRDFNIVKCKPIPLRFKLNEKTTARIIGPGWLKGQWLAVSRGRVITVIPPGRQEAPVGYEVKVKIVRNKDNIYIGVLD